MWPVGLNSVDIMANKYQSGIHDLASVGDPKQHVKLQQPRNYEFGMFQFKPSGVPRR